MGQAAVFNRIIGSVKFDPKSRASHLEVIPNYGYTRINSLNKPGVQFVAKTLINLSLIGCWRELRVVGRSRDSILPIAITFKPADSGIRGVQFEQSIKGCPTLDKVRFYLFQSWKMRIHFIIGQRARKLRQYQGHYGRFENSGHNFDGLLPVSSRKYSLINTAFASRPIAVTPRSFCAYRSAPQIFTPLHQVERQASMRLLRIR